MKGERRELRSSHLGLSVALFLARDADALGGHRRWSELGCQGAGGGLLKLFGPSTSFFDPLPERFGATHETRPQHDVRGEFENRREVAHQCIHRRPSQRGRAHSRARELCELRPRRQLTTDRARSRAWTTLGCDPCLELRQDPRSWSEAAILRDFRGFVGTPGAKAVDGRDARMQ